MWTTWSRPIRSLACAFPAGMNFVRGNQILHSCHSSTKGPITPRYRDRFVICRSPEWLRFRGRLSVWLSSVFHMNPTGFADLDEAHALAETAITAVEAIRDGAFWKLLGDEHPDFGRQLEILARIVYAAQVHHAGAIDQLGLAKDRSCPSTQAL